ncbi:MAG: aspartate carbamoyltransferase [Bacteroidales bacterium]|jgi:aspartate carbamoyltransferase catalytic subunit|nr:aspartate carbamoyltransferase [Bacteroidales bacterium]MDI9592323.1 aspartate carbamoyltransferase [Bacteroidota bacterium]OQC37318.1 MAG: Aspartate carbamoyltransferase [Bacteroidetes bacterium ADurb.Bin041]MBP7874773.1 aspartate carbamoyltransferase [Bacteroidales bacterium]MCO6467675.1 aspartate carbamoyltransferase [Bacteroidales bacterium]
MKNRSLLSINDFSLDEQLKILTLAAEFEKNPTQKILEGFVVATLFFEPSTRTKLSFESAASRLGAKVIGFSSLATSSVTKGESLKDTILTVSNYADIIVIRHPNDGSARFAAEISPIPVINAGDGANQHPTQTLLDMYSILKTQGRLDNLNITFVGDLKYGRTVHSLTIALTQFNTTFHLVSPVELKLPSYVKRHIKEKQLSYFQYTDLLDGIPQADIIYMTRIQRERFSDPIEYEKVKNAYNLNNSMLINTKENMRILHPLPRVNEIALDVDNNPKAYYFQQALNGVFVRQALLAAILGVK